VAAAIRKRIADGVPGAGEYLPAIRELCEEHDVCIDTVSRALRLLEGEGLIAAEARRGYRVQARVNDPDRGCPIAVVVESAEGRWTLLDAGLIDALQKRARAMGRSLLAVGLSGRDPGTVVEQLVASRAWGVVLDATEPKLLDAVQRAGLCVVLAETWDEGGRFDTVVQDGFRGALAATTHLVSRGHERIGWVGLDTRNGHPQVIERYAGAVAGLARAGRALLPDLCVAGSISNLADIRGRARALLSRPDHPTAILSLWQDVAAAVVQAAEDAGRVPGRDFELVGWDTEESYPGRFRSLFRRGRVQPAITWSMARMAEAALDRLEERRRHPHSPALTLEISTQLRLGDSSPGLWKKG
jgi:DNA-binding LacI/PurR family transcriptional regulator